MTKNTKTILGVVAVAGIGYYLYNQYKKNKGAKNFANYVDDDFFNFKGKTKGQKETGVVQAGTLDGGTIGESGCELVAGNISVKYLSNNRVVCRTGNGTSLICPRSQYGNDCGNV